MLPAIQFNIFGLLASYIEILITKCKNLELYLPFYMGVKLGVSS